MSEIFDRKQEITTLTSLRFFAAFSIFIFHIQIRWPLLTNKFITKLISQCAVGMSLFFILSGFILTYNYYNLENPVHKDYLAFLVKRFARIYPVYVLSGVAFVCFGLFNVTSPYVLVKSFFLILTNIFLIQGWFPTSFLYWNDGATWSLSVEILCYLLFPYLLLYISEQSKFRLTLLLIVAYVLTILPGLSLVLNPGVNTTTIYILPMYRLPEFIIGMITGLLYLRAKKPIKYPSSKVIITVALSLTWLGIVGDKLPAYVGHNFIIIPACALVIHLVSNLRNGMVYSFLNSRLLIFLGESSYSFYLLQGLPILTIERFHSKIIALAPMLNNNILLGFFIGAITFTISSLCYIYIEKPCRKKIIDFYYQSKHARKYPAESPCQLFDSLESPLSQTPVNVK